MLDYTVVHIVINAGTQFTELEMSSVGISHQLGSAQKSSAEKHRSGRSPRQNDQPLRLLAIQLVSRQDNGSSLKYVLTSYCVRLKSNLKGFWIETFECDICHLTDSDDCHVNWEIA